MKKLVIILIAAILVSFNGCSQAANNQPDSGGARNNVTVEGHPEEINDQPDFEVVSNNVTVWEDYTEDYFIILAFEVSNLSNAPLHFKESDFNIVDEYGNLVSTMRSVSAYPPVVTPGSIAVYYHAKRSDVILDENISLIAIPHIEAERWSFRGNQLGIIDSRMGGSAFFTGVVENFSSRTTYNNVHIAVITRTSNNEVVSVMTATIDSIKPREQIEFKAEDIIWQRCLGPNFITIYQSFAYVAP